MEEVIAKHQNIFSGQIGSLKGVQASLKMHTVVTPKFLKPRSVRYALKPAIEKDFEKLENAGMIRQVTDTYRLGITHCTSSQDSWHCKALW